MVITRIRNIAEHAVVGEADDPLRNTRTTLANWLERAFMAPYFVNYHLEHHLFYYVPCYNLPKLHRILRDGPHGPGMEIAQGYADVSAQGDGAATTACRDRLRGRAKCIGQCGVLIGPTEYARTTSVLSDA